MTTTTDIEQDLTKLIKKQNKKYNNIIDDEEEFRQSYYKMAKFNYECAFYATCLRHQSKNKKVRWVINTIDNKENQ